MQAAAHAVARTVQGHWPQGAVLFLCGPGNNGGDALVAAQILREQGRVVSVFSLVDPSARQGTAAWAQTQWQGRWESQCPDFRRFSVVVDGLLGAGLDRPVEGETAALIQALAASKVPVCAIDVPSGLDGATGQARGVVAPASVTVSFVRYKPGHVLYPGRDLCGKLELADIGMPAPALQEATTWLNEPTLWRRYLPQLSAQSHKYTRGHALVIGGDRMTGASRLAARAAQRAGAGLVSMAVPPSVWPVYASALDSIMVAPLDESITQDERIRAWLVGPGAGLGEETRRLTLALLATGRPCVLDADAISSFAAQPQELLGAVHEQCVLTPHSGEFARVFDAELDRLEAARLAARQCGAVMVLKGADTIIAAPDGRALINACAPPWLATGGSGDVLAGLVCGLLTQGMPAFEAAGAAVWLHSQAALEFGPGLIPEDLLQVLPRVWQRLLAME
ncbi:bifunctional NAD(P)H-hydrate repair enzyme [Alcaligenes pakistanensis]|uniref:ADP-dependent (S)-NAD(P)H-hydrate dehydratase n=2 Tax=Alcaligenes pakistanensis TaxID=1482717 RepID=A0A8H9M1Z4_9BURK|nr:bifunctional NAD(P)H-hydrate repair enzyme [Alcaligenes pakistanensis]